MTAGRLQLANIVAGVVIGGLVVGAVAPLVGSDRTTSVSSDAPGFLDGGDDGGAGPTGEPASPGGTGVASDATSPDTANGSASGDTGSGAGGDSGSGAGGGTGSGAGGGTSGGSGGDAAEPRLASDVGITAETIRVGSFTLNCKACRALGVGLDDASHAEMAKAFVDEINARGGVAGRKLELYTADYDPAEDAVNGGGTERAACLELTRNRKVFAVMVGAVFANPCVFDENETPLITRAYAAAFDPETFNRSDGRLWLFNATSGRTLHDWAVQLDRQNLLPEAAKFGIVVLDGDHRKQIERYLLPQLAAAGRTPTHVSVLPNDPSQLPVKAAQEVPAMRSKGVTHVLMGVEYVAAQMWLREAQRNGWKPQYLQSDFPGGAHDFQGDQNSQAADWTGAIAVSGLPEGTMADYRRDPTSRRCMEIYEKATGRTISETLWGHVANYCNAYGVFERAMGRAGVNPTRRSLVQALAGLGAHPMADFLPGATSYGGRYPFGGVRWSANTLGQRKVYQKPCPRPQADSHGCYVPVGPVYRMST